MPGDPQAAPALEPALDELRQSGVIVFPTETFYGLGANALDPEALRRLFALKGREPGKPVGLIAADVAMVERVVADFPDAARRLARSFWPGPLTLVLQARPGLAPELLNENGAVGIRVSPHPLAFELARRLAAPLTATSANRSGAPPAETIEAARQAFGDKIKVYVDGGRLIGGLPSTVADFEQGRPRIIRLGAISEQQMLAALA